MVRLSRAVRVAIEGNARRTSTTTGDSSGAAADTVSAYLPWKPVAVVAVGALVSAAGFFGKMLHDDNLETRRATQADNLAVRAEMQATRKELREDMHALETRVVKSFDKVENSLKEISAYLRPATRK